MTRHQYGISALVSQASFRGETSGSVAKCRLFSQAESLYHLRVSQAKQNHEESAELTLEGSRKFFCVASFVGNMTKSGLGDDLANSVLRYFCCQCEAVIGEIEKNPIFSEIQVSIADFNVRCIMFNSVEYFHL